MSYYKKMIGKLLYLSPVNPDNLDDVDTYLKWLNEDRTLSVNFRQYPLMVSSKSDLDWIYKPTANMHRFAIVLLDNDELIGSISLHNIDHLNRSAYIGIFIGGKEHRNSGYGEEAIRLILNYGFYTMNMHSINLTVLDNNPSGISCYKKVGFREVGRLPEVVFIDGKYVDKICMSILEDEFESDKSNIVKS